MISILAALLLSQVNSVRLIDEGVNVGPVTSINCLGTGVVCSRSGPAGTMTITSGGGSGTVTSASVVTANGVSGSVATATVTPAITLTLGAITPISVAASGTVTGSNLTGTNSGDQTITLTGAINGSGTGAIPTTVNAGAVVPLTAVVSGPPLPTLAARQAANANAFILPCNAVRRFRCRESPSGVHQ